MICLRWFQKKYHWYEVRYVYRIKNVQIFDWKTQIGLSEQNNILNKRKLKKLVPPLHKMEKLLPYLSNGNLDIEITCYIGKFGV